MTKYLLGCLFALLLLPTTGWGAISKIASVSAGSPDTNGFTTGAMDTTTANLIVCGLGQGGGSPTSVVTDSKSNTWSTLTVYTHATGMTSTLVYAINPTVGAGHTFTVTQNGAAAAIGCIAFSGAKTTAPFDVENGVANTVSGTSLATGSVATAVGAVAVTVFSNNVNTSAEAIDNGFIFETFVEFAAGQHFTSGVAYKLNPGTVNPTWSWTTSARSTVAIASFLEGATPTLGQVGMDGSLEDY